MDATDLNPITAQIKANLLWIKLGAIVLILGAFFGAGWWINGWRWESKEAQQLKDLQKELDKERAKYIADKLVWEAQSKVDAAKLNDLDVLKTQLLQTLSGMKLTQTIKVQPNAQGECTADTLSADFRMQWNAVVATATAANLTSGSSQ